MTSIDDNQIRPLSNDQLELVNGGSFLPVPPYHGGPVHTPIIPTGVATPIPQPVLAMPMSGQLM